MCPFADGVSTSTGIGSFTIIDDALVTAPDLGNNFFVDHASLGKSRAATVTAMLLEMNPFVQVTHRDTHTQLFFRFVC